MEWVVNIDGELVKELRLLLAKGPILSLGDEEGHQGDLVEFKKAVVDEVDGFTFVIYSNEHPPPHFHVKYQGEENSFSIIDATPLHPYGLSKYFKNVRKWHKKNKSLLISEWNRLRPTNCPVGAIFV